MIRARILKSGFKTAWTHKLRASFMILSVMIGITALTVIISLGKGTQDEVIGRMKKFFSPNSIMIASGSARMEGMHAQMNPTTTLKIADIDQVVNNVGNILSWDALQMALDRSVTFDGKTATVNVYGQTASAENVWNLVVTEGRFFTQTEDKGLARVALIAPNVQRQLFGTEDAVGRQVEIDGVPFQVIGTLAPRGLDPHGMNQDDQIIVPLNTLLRRLVNQDYVFAARVLVADKGSINATADRIRHLMREQHHISPNENDDFMVETADRIDDMIRNVNSMFNVYLPAIALVSLLVGSIVIANLMLLSVNERTKEIGLRKDVGSTSRDILTQFLIESSSITVLGGVVGLAVGLLALTHLTKMMGIPFVVSWAALVASLVISSVIGIAAGIVPARRAASLQPAQSLK